MNGSNEGFIFTNPMILTNGQAKGWVADNFPYASAAFNNALTKLYPIPLFSSGRYLTEFGRIENMIAGNCRPTCSDSQTPL
jgi:hypothetical protein